jgi:hypothetical protein
MWQDGFMPKEPILTFKLSRPGKFHCSSCRDVAEEGAFTLEGRLQDLIDAFKTHVKHYHSKGEDFSQAAARIVRQATKD